MGGRAKAGEGSGVEVGAGVAVGASTVVPVGAGVAAGAAVVPQPTARATNMLTDTHVNPR